MRACIQSPTQRLSATCHVKRLVLCIVQEGYVDVFKRLADRSSTYHGDYLTFFVAFSGKPFAPPYPSMF